MASIVAATTIGVFLLRHEDRIDRERAFRAQARLAAAALQRAIDSQVARVEVAQATLNGQPDPVDTLRDAAAGAGPDSVLQGVDVVGTEAATTGTGRVTFADAADRGVVRATPPLALPTGGRGSLLVGPIYRTREPGTTVTARRAALAGFVVAVADPGVLIRRAGLESSSTLRVNLEETGELLAATGDPARGRLTVDIEIDVADKGWTASLSPARDLGASNRWWLAVLGGMVAVSLVGTALAAAEREAAEARRRAAERESELRLVSETGPLLQSSLDVGELLPEFAVRLAEELDLDQLGVILAEEQSGATEIFTLGGSGTRPPGPLAELPPPPGRVLPGTEVFLPLQRSGRVVGALRVRARGGLDPSRMRAALAAGDLLGAALGNAQLYAREQDAVRRLREVDELRTSFVSTVSHELRTTVTAIYGFADLLSERWSSFSDEQRLSFVGRVHRNAITLQSMVDDLLAFSRLDRRGFSLNPEPIDLAELVGELLDRLAPLLEQHRLIVRLDQRVSALTDPAAVERILANLVSNAAKFSPAGSQVTVAVDRLDDHVRLVVEDEGPGVEPAERERVFARFYRGTSQAAVSTRGTGVGLAVVRELTELLGGRVVMDEAASGGARVIVLLPAPGPDASPVGGSTPATLVARQGGDDGDGGS